jgi:hypothetical protein
LPAGSFLLLNTGGWSPLAAAVAQPAAYIVSAYQGLPAGFSAYQAGQIQGQQIVFSKNSLAWIPSDGPWVQLADADLFCWASVTTGSGSLGTESTLLVVKVWTVGELFSM